MNDEGTKGQPCPHCPHIIEYHRAGVCFASATCEVDTPEYWLRLRMLVVDLGLIDKSAGLAEGYRYPPSSCLCPENFEFVHEDSGDLEAVVAVWRDIYLPRVPTVAADLSAPDMSTVVTVLGGVVGDLTWSNIDLAQSDFVKAHFPRTRGFRWLLCWGGVAGHFWFRVFDRFGLVIKDTRRHELAFSEREGRTRHVRIGPWYIKAVANRKVRL